MRATAHILGRRVLGQTRAGIQSCIAINKKDDDRRAILKNIQRAHSEVMREKEEAAARGACSRPQYRSMLRRPSRTSSSSRSILHRARGQTDLDRRNPGCGSDEAPAERRVQARRLDPETGQGEAARRVFLVQPWERHLCKDGLPAASHQRVAVPQGGRGRFDLQHRRRLSPLMKVKSENKR